MSHHQGGSLSLCLIPYLSWSKTHIKVHELSPLSLFDRVPYGTLGEMRVADL